MKRLLFFAAALLMTVVIASAQTIVKGDMNDDGLVTIADVTSVVNVAVGRVPMETINVSASPLTYYTKSTSLCQVTGVTMSQTTLSMNSGTTGQLSVTITPSTAFNQTVTWTSSDESVATVDQNGLVSGVAGGSCIITATSTDGSGVQATCQVTVFEDKSGTIDGRDYVDLGLPSGTLWATMNVGATSPEDYGDYFA